MKCLGLDPGTENALTFARVKTAGDVARLIEGDDLEMLRHVWPVRRAEIEQALCVIGLHPTLPPCVSGAEHAVQAACPVRCLGVKTRTVEALRRADARTVGELLRLIAA